MSAEGQHPNILIICSDQHHPRMVGYRDYPHVKTPNIDRLAQVMKGPGIPKDEVDTETPVSLVDLYPTVLDMAGVALEPDLPGASWLPLIRGDDHDRSDYVFAEWHGPQLRGAYYTIIQGDYKYTWYEFHPPSLFNMMEDPKEMCDLASDPAQAKRLTAFEAELRSIVDPRAVALQAKKDLGLIDADGTDLTDSLTPWSGFEDGTVQKIQRADSARHRRT